MNQWETFRQYQEQQRKLQAEREREAAQKRQRAIEEAARQQALRELQRRAVEHRQSMQKEAEQNFIQMKRQHAQEMRYAEDARQAAELRQADALRNTALGEVRRHMMEIRQSLKNGSPIEIAFYEAWCALYPSIPLERQYPIGKYRVDFAHVETHTVIELDGQSFHSKRKDRNKDYDRHIEIEEMGWHIVRFTGSKVFHDVEGCVHIAWRRIQEHMAR